MIRSALFAAVALSAAGSACSSTSDEYTPDEPGNFTVHCNKSSLRWNACYEKAARLCGESGYTIVSEDDSAMPTATTNIYEVPVIGGSIVIRCNR